MLGRNQIVLVVWIGSVILALACAPELENTPDSNVKEMSAISPSEIDEQKTATSAAAFDADEVFSDGGARGITSECCDDPGDLAECWHQDAVDDGVACDDDADCPLSSCNETYGVCKCNEPSDCGSGVCTSLNLCGPSYCNGFKICSCFGGCTEVEPGGTPDVICDNAGLACCNGEYPIHPDLREGAGEVGYCSLDYTCDGSEGGDACSGDADCPDDEINCTDDYCDWETTLCVYEPDNSLCADTNVCTDDICDNDLGCVYVANTDLCDDENACTEDDICSDGTCEGADIDCTDGNICTDDNCDPATGCIYPFNTESCDDVDECTVDDICSGGVCTGDLRDCSDGNQCTGDTCNSATGCVYANLTTPCDDADACTVGDLCADGFCVSGGPLDCSDSNLCTDDSCDVLTGCVYGNNTLVCDDGNACSTPDVCAAGNCEPGPAVVCDDTNICTDDSCDPASGCAFADNTDACDDLDDCSFDDQCSGGSCIGDPLDCDDSNFCTDDLCDAELGCEYEYNDELCDDSNACTFGDICSVGDCAGVLIHWRFEEELWDGTTDQVLDSADMYHGTSQNDAYPIPDGKVGQAGRFEPGSGSNVGQVETTYHIHENSKTVAFWIKFDAVLGEHQAVGSFSGAGKRFYLGIDTDNEIFAGYGDSFVGWSKPSVPSGFVADQWYRMAMTYDGTHAHVYVNNVEMIDFEADFNSAGLGPVFFLGTQAGGVELDEVVVDQRYWDAAQVALDYDDGDGPNPYMYTTNCDDNNGCTDDSCDHILGCVNEPNVGACDDGNACTLNDTCADGSCQGVAFDCDDGDICTDDTCDLLLGCVYTDNTAGCDDGDECTMNDTCAGGSCTGLPMTCDDSNPCTDDICEDGTGCVYNNNTDACDDLNSCTSDDACAGGMCSGDALDCGDGDACTADACAPGIGCTNTPIDPCDECTLDTDCLGLIVCDTQPTGCNYEACVGGSCVCETEPIATECTGYSEAEFPDSCFDGLCDGDGACVPTEHDAYNNLCSDVFESGDPTTIDIEADSYMGSIANTVMGGDLEAKLKMTGSTLCANNNYYATGDECQEAGTGNDIGFGGRDLVYVFRYQTNAAEQYELYSYVVKVEADYDIGIYIKTDIDEADDCPEGDNPELDEYAETFLGVPSNTCFYPYQNDPMPPVVEDECDDNGNSLNGQDCCDPCIAGATCGYKWCKRGYNNDGSACDMCAGSGAPEYDPETHKGDCDELWTYPDDPFSCDSETPVDPGYDDFDYMANAVISPDGATDGSWRTVFIFVDGVDAAQGNFYLSVEKRRWWAAPCDRVNDDGRVYDVTHVGAVGETFTGTLENVVNSTHNGGGACGGYDCGAGWSGKSTCHDSGTANEFWPNSEVFKIHRSVADGAQTYCVQTDESITDGADVVLSLWQRASSALTICDESYSDEGCERNSDGNNIQWEFVADADRLYLLDLSQYSSINRVCSPTEGDNCHYKVTVTEGSCPTACVDPSTWYGDSILGTVTLNGATFAPSSEISGDTSIGSVSNYDVSNWTGPDDLWQLDVSAASTVRFSCCDGSGSCFQRSRMKLYDCMHNQIASNGNGCGSNRPRFTADLLPGAGPYYLLVDGKIPSKKGPYTIQLTYL